MARKQRREPDYLGVDGVRVAEGRQRVKDGQAQDQDEEQQRRDLTQAAAKLVRDECEPAAHPERNQARDRKQERQAELSHPT